MQGPVWKQLEERCGKSTLCLQARLQRQDAQITAQQADVARLQQQLAVKDSQLADRDTVVHQLQRELAELRS